MSLGKRLKRIRLEKGLSLRQLGKLAQVSHSFIADIESGRSRPSLDTLEALAQALQVSVAELTGGTIVSSSEEQTISSTGSVAELVTGKLGTNNVDSLLTLLLTVPALTIKLVEAIAGMSEDEKEKLLDVIHRGLTQAREKEAGKDIIDISDLDEDLRKDAEQYIEWLRTKQKLSPKHDETSAGLENVDKRKAEGE